MNPAIFKLANIALCLVWGIGAYLYTKARQRR